MKIILLICKTRYRKNNLNNFYDTSFIGKYLIITFSGIFFYLGILIAKLKIFKVISIDAQPFISENKGFNFWLTGTIHKIPEKFEGADNNYVNMKSIFHNKDKVFQLYPIIKKSFITQKEIKIVNISNCKIRRPELSNKIINEFNYELNENLTLLDSKKFWTNKNYFNNKNHLDNFLIYRDLQINQRINIAKQIMSEFKDNFLLFGSDWKEYFDNSFKNLTNNRKIKNIYNGNICIDFGSAAGSLSLYPRSIQIIESGGYLLQLKQVDSLNIFGEHENHFTYTDIDDLSKKIRQLINNRDLFNKRINDLATLFKNSKLLIEDQLFVE